MDRVIESVHNIAIGRRHIHESKVLSDRLPGYRHLAKMQKTLVGQHLKYHRDTTDPVDVDHVVLPVGLGVGQMRLLCRHTVEVI